MLDRGLVSPGGFPAVCQVHCGPGNRGKINEWWSEKPGLTGEDKRKGKDADLKSRMETRGDKVERSQKRKRTSKVMGRKRRRVIGK